MRDWIIKNWRGLLLNGVALAIMTTLLRQYRPLYFEPFFNPVFENSGKWAIRFLLFSLAMTPLNIVFKWRWAPRLNKPAGLWAFAFATLHYLTYSSFRPLRPFWLHKFYGPYVIPGLIGLLILLVMAITSHRWAMRWLGKSWKRLHRLVYGVGLLVTIHALWAFSSSKTVLERPNDVYEYRLYIVVVIVLLAIRIPIVRRWFRRRPISPTNRDYVAG